MSMMPLRYTIKLNPVTKKNSQQMGFIGPKCPHCGKGARLIPFQSKQYKQYEHDCALFLRPAPVEPIACPVNVKCTFYMQTRRLVDQTNLQEAVDDILVKYKVLKDDNRDIVASHDGSRVMYDKVNPRTEIVITELPEDAGYEQWKER